MCYLWFLSHFHLYVYLYVKWNFSLIKANVIVFICLTWRVYSSIWGHEILISVSGRYIHMYLILNNMVSIRRIFFIIFFFYIEKYLILIIAMPTCKYLLLTILSFLKHGQFPINITWRNTWTGRHDNDDWQWLIDDPSVVAVGFGLPSQCLLSGVVSWYVKKISGLIITIEYYYINVIIIAFWAVLTLLLNNKWIKLKWMKV